MSTTMVIVPMNGTVGSLSNKGVAAAASVVIKATPGRLFQMIGVNNNVAARFIQLHDAISLPADTAVPVFSIPVGIGASFNIDWGIYGRQFRTGIVIASSSTLATLTIGGADMFVDAQFN